MFAKLLYRGARHGLVKFLQGGWEELDEVVAEKHRECGQDRSLSVGCLGCETCAMPVDKLLRDSQWNPCTTHPRGAFGNHDRGTSESVRFQKVGRGSASQGDDGRKIDPISVYSAKQLECTKHHLINGDIYK